MSGQGRLSRSHAMRAQVSLSASVVTRALQNGPCNQPARPVTFTDWFFAPVTPPAGGNHVRLLLMGVG